MADMTAVDPTGISAAGKGALYWVPAIANTSAPKLTELAAGTNLSKIVYAWQPNGKQGKQEHIRYGYTSAGQSLGLVKYDPAELEYDYDPQTTDSATGEYKHFVVLAPGTKGFLVDRRGLAPSAATAVGQVVSVYPAELGAQLPIDINPKNDGETLRVQQSIGIIGDVVHNVKLVA